MERQIVNSSNINSIGYDPDSNLLEVEFNDGGVYQYLSVPTSIYQAFISAGSYGTYFHKFIKEKFSYKKLK
jgi:hypothetical protein